MRIKVRGGTALSGAMLCESCRYCTLVKGETENERIYYCNEMGRMMRFRVVECGAYQNQKQPHKWELEKIGWLVEVDRMGKIGFSKPKPQED